MSLTPEEEGKQERTARDERALHLQKIEEQRKKELEDAKEKFERAKDSDVPTYINALSNLAYCYRTVKKYDEADALYKGALCKLKKGMSVNDFNTVSTFLWRFLGYVVNDTDFEHSCDTLIEACESAGMTDIGTMETSIRTRATNRAQCYRTIWKHIIDARTRERGPNEHSLSRLYFNYASACEQSGELEEAEKAFLQAQTLLHSRDAWESASALLSLASFYLRHRMLEKAESAWQTARSLDRDNNYFDTARGFIDLVTEYEKANRVADSERLLFSLLEDGGQNIVKAFEPKLESIYCDYLRTCQFEQAEKLVQLRLKASANCRSDLNALDWRLKLSDLCLVLGRVQESEKIFMQIVAANALQGIPSQLLIRNREELKERLTPVGTSGLTRPLDKSVQRDCTSPIRIQYCLLGLHEVSLCHNISIHSYDSSDPNSEPGIHNRAGGEFGNVCSLGVTRIAGNFSVHGKIYGKAESDEGRFHSKNILPAPADLEVPPALTAPADAKELSNTPIVAFGKLEPGDYVADQFHGSTHCWSREERYRIFLRDNENLNQPIVLDISANQYDRRPVNLQIWYNGFNKLRLGTLSAVVYAPNAVVELRPSSTFCGAIVARRIIADAHEICFDKSLFGIDFIP